jgi:hypothetical protein
MVFPTIDLNPSLDAWVRLYTRAEEGQQRFHLFDFSFSNCHSSLLPEALPQRQMTIGAPRGSHFITTHRSLDPVLLRLNRSLYSMKVKSAAERQFDKGFQCQRTGDGFPNVFAKRCSPKGGQARLRPIDSGCSLFVSLLLPASRCRNKESADPHRLCR